MAAAKPLFRTFVLLSACCLSACAVDLGVFEKGDGYESYYESFGDVTCLYDGGSVDYDIKDSLFNDETVQRMSWKDEDDAVEEKQYLYLILPFEAELKIESIALYVRSPEAANFVFSCFYFAGSDLAPKKIRYLTSPATETIEGSDGPEEKEIEYDDPPVEDSLVHGEISLIRQEWTSFVLGNFNQEGYDDGYLHAGEDALFYLRVENNSGFNVDELDPLTFMFINLLVRAV